MAHLVRRALLHVGDLRALVRARLADELRTGIMLAALPASWRAALQGAAPQAKWMVLVTARNGTCG